MYTQICETVMTPVMNKSHAVLVPNKPTVGVPFQLIGEGLGEGNKIQALSLIILNQE